MEVQIIREEEKYFSIQDLLRLARYIDDGRNTEDNIRFTVSNWLQGPELTEGIKRFKIINDNGTINDL